MTASNWSFFKSYAPTEGEPPVLKGLLNFYLQILGLCATNMSRVAVWVWRQKLESENMEDRMLGADVTSSKEILGFEDDHVSTLWLLLKWYASYGIN